MTEILLDAIIDSVKILPFLFITYLIMEYIEHKMTEKSKTTIKKAGKWGPLLGSTVRNNSTMWIFSFSNKFVFSKGNKSWNFNGCIFINIR